VSLSPSYLDHLTRLPKSRRLQDFTPGAAGVFLRHDVDHDLDLALEMAYWEHASGHRCTYFILPTAPYASDPRLLTKLRQMQAFGHEVGLHLNFLASWARGETAAPGDAAAALLREWREAGLEVVGCAAHGDRACYEFGFINYWMFRELRPEDPERHESGLSPEGIPDPDPGRAIRYPASHQLQRGDGGVFPLWSVSLEALGLRYHATHLPTDHYYSDSGGRWTRTVSPFDADLARGSHQVLMHPEYYRGEPRRVFVVSTARSGSKWLASIAEAATPCRAVHEFTLNHRMHGDELVAEKRTHAGFTALQRDPEAAASLILQARNHVDSLATQDFLECNVYLTHFLPQLRVAFPEAAIVELHRHPKDVVRSLLNREWYDTPEDDRHPLVDDPRWDAAGQLERACLYVADAHQQAKRFAQQRVALERLSASPDAVRELFASLGIAFYPLLAEPVFGTRINANTQTAVPEYASWAPADQGTFERICGPLVAELGYAGGSTPRPATAPGAQPRLRQESRTLYELRQRKPFSRLSSDHLRLRRSGESLDVTGSREHHGHILVGGGSWVRLLPFLHGWRNRASAYFKVSCRADVPAGEITLFGLCYDAFGRLVQARRISRVSPSLPRISSTFRVSDPRCRWVNIGLYFAKSPGGERRYSIHELKAELVSLSIAG
jgi:hypothetical protein